MKLTVTINFPDGREINDVEVECGGLDDMPKAIQSLINAHGAAGYSSLVVLVVPED